MPLSNQQGGQLKELERIKALQFDLEAVGILPAPQRTIVQRLGPVLMAVTAVLVGGGLGLAAILVAWFTYVFAV